MAVSRAVGQQDRILPDSMEETFKRWCVQLLGLALFVLALIGWACLASWSINDPSLNNATTGIPQNALGLFGASVADALFQTLGLASIFVFLPLTAWGWYCVSYDFPGAIISRIIAWPLAIISLAGFISVFPTTPAWPLPLGLGGILGDGLLLKLPEIFQPMNIEISKTAAAIVLIVIGLPLLLFSLALRFSDFFILFNLENVGIKAILLAFIGGLIHFGFEFRNFFFEIIQRYHDERNARKRTRSKGHHFARQKAYDNFNGQTEQNTEDWEPPRIFNDYPTFSNDDKLAGGKFDEDEEELEFDLDDRILEYSDDNLVRKKRNGTFSAFTRHFRSNQEDGETGKRPKKQTRFALPIPRLLNKPQGNKLASDISKDKLKDNAELLQEVLSDFGIHGTINHIHAGPVVTLYEFEPARGTKSARVIGLANDIARSMSAISARVSVIPGRNAIGIELPNDKRATVYLRELFESRQFVQSRADLPLALGHTISGEPVIADLARMPHLLIAGTTGSGKSVGINAMILSLLFRLPPDKCKFILIDPKMLELSIYDGIPNLLSPVVTDPKKAVTALKWTVQEMEERYKNMSKLNVRNIAGYNDRVEQARLSGEILSRTVQTGFDKETGQAIYEHEEMNLEPMPYIVVVIDEMADLMMVAGKDIEAAVQRLAQMARAAGIHLIMATQRPSVDVITGTIKANFPTRISYQVSSKIDSRTVLGEQGAEQLLGAGDMLYLAGAGRMIRAHGPFITDEEIETVVNMLKEQGIPEYLAEVTEIQEDEDVEEEVSKETKAESLYDQAVDVVLRDKKVSISYVQRRLSIGYNKAATLIERMEEEGLISEPNRAGKRQILVN